MIEEFISEVKSVEKIIVPKNVIHRTKLALLDYIGVTLAGYYEQRELIKTIIESFCGISGEIYPVGISTPMSMNNAVFLNGLNAHALDFDDGTNAGIIHLGSPIFSVLLALAQKYDLGGEELLKAAIIGYETSFTMAKSIQPMHKKRGYHATATCGLLGIAMASSLVLKFDENKTKQAISIAALSATGSLKVLEDSSQLKPYNVGKTALLGLISVQMANAGFIGPDDAFSGVAGFLNQMYGSESVQFVPCMMNETYAIEKAYIKPYAACRYTHPSIDVALELRKKIPVQNDDIESVSIKTYSLAVKNHDHIDIKGSASAKMSIPYNFAVTYLTGKTGMEAFTKEILDDPSVIKLTKKVTVEEDALMTAAFPKETMATVSMRFKDGSICEGKSILPKGEPENPLSDEEIFEKFKKLALYGGKTLEDAERIIDAVMNVESQLPALLNFLK
ncbi:MAG TPA: MmgE/PrpD family protein [Bacteroidetes bacterium]|nr:MmgE/PrpD family protein [Candidatus Limimorpha avicola]